MMQVKNLTFTYGKRTANECKVLDNISFEIRKGEFIGLIGSSGSGKTTLIKHLNGLLKADSGDILFNGLSIYDKKYVLSKLSKEVGLVFQYPEQQLFKNTVIADVSFGPLNMGMSHEEAEESARKSLELVGIDISYYYVSPLELSGGQKRCVAIAGVLAMNPQILVMDEPAAGLDPGTRRSIYQLVEKIKKERNIAVVLVSHHMEDVAEYADRVFVLHDHKLVREGTVKEVFSQIDYLNSIGIGVPQITNVTENLRLKGFPIEHAAITVDEAENMILEVLKSEKGEIG